VLRQNSSCAREQPALPASPPQIARERGDALRPGSGREAIAITISRSAVEFSPSPAQRGRGPGGGGSRGRNSIWFEARRSVGNPTSPRSFWGRCEPKRAEGALRRIVRIAIISLAFIFLPPPLAAQPADGVVVGGMRVHPDTVTVGERFRAAVAVRAPAGTRVELVVAPAADGRYETVGDPRVHGPDSTGLQFAVATMVLWVTDPAGSAPAEARVTLPDGAVQTFSVPLPLPFVRSVLPADSAQPRPPKDIIPHPRRDWTWAWIAAGIVVALALLALWWIRRGRRPRVIIPIDPRRHALAELDRLHASSVIEADGVEAFTAEVSRVLREFAAAVDARLGTDLTTEELIELLRRTGAREEDVGSIAGALAHADLAKFARARPTPERALEDWEASRRWVQTFRAVDEGVPELAGTGR
jgi:hypothetical protein